MKTSFLAIWPPDRIANPMSLAGSLGLSAFEWFGGITRFSVRLMKAAARPPYEMKELFRQMDEIGAKSLPLVALAGAAIGVVLSLHTRDSLTQFRSEERRVGKEC